MLNIWLPEVDLMKRDVLVVEETLDQNLDPITCLIFLPVNFSI